MTYFDILGCVYDSQVAEKRNIYAELEIILDTNYVHYAFDSRFWMMKKNFMVLQILVGIINKMSMKCCNI